MRTMSNWPFGIAQLYAPRQFKRRMLKLTVHLQLAQKGNYKEAFARMNKVEPERLRAFKYNNAWTYYSGLLQLRRQICR